MNYAEQETVTRIRRLVASLSERATSASLRRSQAFLGLTPVELESYSLIKAIALKSERPDKEGFDGLEGECDAAIRAVLGAPTSTHQFYIPVDVLCRQPQRRDLDTSSVGSGGALVGTDNQGFIDVLHNRSVCFSLGARHLMDLKSTISFPRGATETSASWLSTESSQASESTPGFEQVYGSPHTVAAYTEISRQLMLQSSPDAEAVLLSILGGNLASASDAVAIQGAGSGGQPQGIIGATGVGTISAGSMNYDKTLEFQGSLAQSSSILNAAAVAYVTTPSVALDCKKRLKFTGADTALWTGSIHRGEIDGHTAVSTLNCPSATMICGDWSQLAIGQWGTLLIEVDPFTKFKYGLIGVRGMLSVDVMLLHPQSFCVMQNAT